MYQFNKLNFRGKLFFLFGIQIIGILLMLLASVILIFINKRIAYCDIYQEDFLLFLIAGALILLFNQWIYIHNIKKALSMEEIMERKKHVISCLLMNLVTIETIAIFSFLLFLITANGAFMLMPILIIFNLFLRLLSPQAVKYYPHTIREKLPKMAI